MVRNTKDESFKDFVSISCKNWMASRRGGCLAATGSIGTKLSSASCTRGKLYFKVDESTVGEYRKRKMKPFRPNAKQTLKNYYQVPVEIIEDGERLGAWAEAAIRCQRKKH